MPVRIAPADSLLITAVQACAERYAMVQCLLLPASYSGGMSFEYQFAG